VGSGGVNSMGLNQSKGDMYPWITDTFNMIKGECPHLCGYCYMTRFGKQKPVRFDRKELKTDLGEGNFIFVGSSCDMFSEDIPNDWIVDTLTKCNWYNNRYLFQSKNPARIANYLDYISMPFVVCTTLETNRWYPDIMRNAPKIEDRVRGMESIKVKKYVTIEPIMDFDLEPFVELVKRCEPEQVNIGADSGNNGLPEPSLDKVLALKEELAKFTTIAQKKNLNRLMKEHV
jgi:DNA repair photolyase